VLENGWVGSGKNVRGLAWVQKNWVWLGVKKRPMVVYACTVRTELACITVKPHVETRDARPSATAKIHQDEYLWGPHVFLAEMAITPVAVGAHGLHSDYANKRKLVHRCYAECSRSGRVIWTCRWSRRCPLLCSVDCQHKNCINLAFLLLLLLFRTCTTRSA